MQDIKSAVILAAGMGTRLRKVIEDVPKGLLEVGGKKLIFESLKRLTANGIEDIIIVTGYASDKYELALKKEYPNVRFILNKDFDSTGSMHSLFQIRNQFSTGFLLLESDLLYEDRSIPALINSEYNNAILISGQTGSGDEVYVCGENELVQHINKEVTEQFSCQGELVGISKISLTFFEQLCGYYEQNLKSLRLAHYEECISDLSSTNPVYYLKVPDLVWTEIDNPDHFQRALDEIFPRIYGYKPI